MAALRNGPRSVSPSWDQTIISHIKNGLLHNLNSRSTKDLDGRVLTVRRHLSGSGSTYGAMLNAVACSVSSFSNKLPVSQTTPANHISWSKFSAIKTYALVDPGPIRRADVYDWDGISVGDMDISSVRTGLATTLAVSTMAWDYTRFGELIRGHESGERT